jgi:hypothetical protein
MANAEREATVSTYRGEMSGGNLARLCFGDGFPETAKRFSDRLPSCRGTFGVHGTSRHRYTNLLSRGAVESQFRAGCAFLVFATTQMGTATTACGV